MSDGESQAKAVEIAGSPKTPEQRLLPGYELLVSRPLSELPAFFDDLGMDLKFTRGSRGSTAKTHPFLLSFCGPGDPKSKDIRFKTVVIEPNPDAPAEKVARAIAHGDSPLKATFKCRGHVGLCGKDCSMRIRVNVFADHLQTAYISTKDFHPAPEGVKRKPSKLLRAQAFDFLAKPGATAGQFHFAVQAPLLANDNNVDPEQVMSFKQLNDLASRAKRATFGTANFASLQRLADQDPKHILLQDPPEDSSLSKRGKISQTNSSFMCGITDILGFSNAILLAHGYVMGMDTSWRRKSIQNAPLSLIATFDRVTRRSLPLALLFSANIQQSTLVRFLEWFKAAVQAFATDLLSKDEQSWPRSLSGHADRVRDVAENGFLPRLCLIDKSRAERNALKAVFPTILVRLCFWHIKNAIAKWQGSVGETQDNDRQGNDDSIPEEALPRSTIVPKNLRGPLYKGFLAVARAESEQEFEDNKTTFLETQVTDIIASGAADRTEQVRAAIVTATRAYFRKNWFNETWTETFADYKVPTDIALGDVNTDNICESAFKLLDRVVLGGRFHLAVAVVLLRRYWQYTERVEPPKLSAQHHASMADGASLWEQGKVTAGSSPNVCLVTRANGTTATVDLGKSRRSCSVPACCLIPSPCKHFYAAELFRSNGLVEKWMAGERPEQWDAEGEQQTELDAMAQQQQGERQGNGSIALEHEQQQERNDDEQEDPMLFGEDDNTVDSQVIFEPISSQQASSQEHVVDPRESTMPFEQTVGSQRSSQVSMSTVNPPVRLVAYTPSIHLAGLGNRWPRSSSSNGAVNFQLGKRGPVLSPSSDEDEQPNSQRSSQPSKRARVGRPPARPNRGLPPKCRAFSRAASSILSDVFVAAEKARIKEPFGARLNRLVGLAGKTAWERCVTPSANVTPPTFADLRATFTDPILRQLVRTSNTAEPSILDMLGALFGSGAHRPVGLTSDCCTFSHTTAKVPAVFHVEVGSAEKFGKTAFPPVDQLAFQSMVGAITNFRVRTCSAEPNCPGVVNFAWPAKGLNHVVATVFFDEGVRADLHTSFSVTSAVDGLIRRHRLVAVIYGKHHSNAFVSRVVGKDGRVQGWAVDAEGRGPEETGVTGRLWEDWSARERFFADSKPAIAAIYVLVGQE